MTENDPHAPGSAAGRQDPGAQPGTEGQAAWQQTPAQPAAEGQSSPVGPATGGSQPEAGSAGPAAGAFGTAPESAPNPPAGGPYGAAPESTPNPWSAQAASAPQGGSAPQPGASPAQGASAPHSGPVPAGAHPGAGEPYSGQYAAYGAAGQPTPPTGIPVNPYGAPGTAAYGVPPQREKKNSAGKLLAGVALVSLVIGGVAGGTVGYLTGGSSGPSVNALDQPKPAQQTGNVPAGSVESVAQKLSPSVVELQVSGRTAAGEGSGFILSNDGYILTNNHVVEVAANGGQIQAVFQDGKKAAAKVVGRDPTTDIAVVKVSGVGNLTPVSLGRSDDLRVGQQVVAIGSPFELTGTVTSGIVSSLHRPVQAGGDQTDQATVMDAIQTDAAINPGNSGGPLANMDGQVIGINSAIYSPNSGRGQGSGSEGGNVGIGFAIPIDQARRTADDIIKTGHANQTFIGAKVGDAPQGGAQLGDITPGSPAEKAGLKSGDVVTKIDSRVIDSANTLVAAIRTRAPGEQVTFTLADGRTVQVTLGGQPVQVN
ncbi:trypsin-like peptidase domain-containing protein [Amycolatopsis benzoatilytica]|uniref:trypsin-like peptidase domain-containing protein n=1 Tax=Amycolatopsis benzoatilytica TaxID=346045 RepID=UPI00036CFECE|nr:trypsin-like peptidase domain-containing protein [Amycolatopsis benzoatilytica]